MTKILPPLRYQTANEQRFHQALSRGAQVYLAANNDHRFANAQQLIKATLLALCCVACYLLSLWQTQAWSFSLYYFAFVMLGMLLNVNVNHDASHNVFLRSPWANRLVGRLVTLPLGIDPDYWRVRHVQYHHRYANVEHYDLDTEENGFFRQMPGQQQRAYMRYQHLYWPLIAALSLPYIAWVFDWADRRGKTALAQDNILPGRSGWLLFIGSKLGHLILVLVIPLLAADYHGLTASTVLLTYLCGQMLASVLVVFLLLGTHWAEAELYPAPTDGQMPHGWYQHNFATACDWLPSPRWLQQWMGGLNMHLTHHLFPGWHHRHYPALAALIQRLAVEHNMDYRCIGYRELWRQQQQFLRAMGRGEPPPTKRKG